MGILSFTRKSRKQGQRLPFALEEHLPSREAHIIPLQKPKEPPRNYFEPSTRRQSETSLLDDILKELDTKDQPKVISTEKSRQSLQPLLKFDDAEAYNPAVIPSEQYAETNSSTPTSQVRLKPLISFANEQPDMIAMEKRDTILHSDNTNLSSYDADDEPILSKQRQMKRHSIVDVTQAQQAQQVQQATSYVKIKPPAKPINRNIMDRMKERHRQEARMSLQTIPFIDSPMQQVRSHPLSSPSMPIIYNPINEKQPPSKPTNALIQSPSFSPYSPPQNHMVRSASFATDIYGGKNYPAMPMPIKAQSDINLRPAPTSPYAFMRTPSYSQINVRVGYQQAPIYTPSLQPENTFLEEPLQLEPRYMNRSNSAHLLSNQIHPLQRSSETIQQKQENNKTAETLPSPVEKQKQSPTTMKKPLYERAISPEPRYHYHHHSHHKESIEPVRSLRASTSEFASHTDIPDTPPPELHSRHIVATTMEDENLPPSPASIHSNVLSNDVEGISESKNGASTEDNQKPISENPIVPVKEEVDTAAISTVDKSERQQEQEMLKNKADDHSVAETLAGSEISKKSIDSTAQDKGLLKSKTGIYRVFQLPDKLRQELRGVQIRRSSYSVPDLTTFTKQDESSSITLTATHWSEIESTVPLNKVEINEIKINAIEKTKSIQTDQQEKSQELISYPKEYRSQTITPSVSRVDLHSCCSNVQVSCCQRNNYSCHNGSDHHYCYSSQSHRCHSCSHKHSNHSSSCSNNNSYCHHKSKSYMKKSSSICSAMKLDHHSMMSHSPSQQHIHSHHCGKRRNKHRHSSDRHESSHRHHCSHSRYRLDESHLFEETGGY